MTNPDEDLHLPTQQQMESLRELFETRFAEYDKAIQLLQQKADSQPTPGVLEERLIASYKLNDVRFQELKERTVELATSSNKSLDLALQSAEKAVTKSEAAVNKQIDAISTQVAQAVSSLEKRVTTMEAGGQGSKQSYNTVLSVAALGISAILAVIAVISIIPRVAP